MLKFAPPLTFSVPPVRLRVAVAVCPKSISCPLMLSVPPDWLIVAAEPSPARIAPVLKVPPVIFKMPVPELSPTTNPVPTEEPPVYASPAPKLTV